MKQDAPIKYSPVNGRLVEGLGFTPDFFRKDEWAWYFNPWTGEKRDMDDINCDKHGHMIVPPDPPAYAHHPGELIEDSIPEFTDKPGGVYPKVRPGGVHRTADPATFLPQKCDRCGESFVFTHVCLGPARARQEGGTHYKDMGVQPWDVVDTWPREQRIGYYRGGALKYLMRMGAKDESVQEIAKGQHYMEKLLEVLRGTD